MNRVTLIRNFASLACGEHVIIPRERDVWSMQMWDSHPRLVLPVDLDARDESDKLFRADFVARCPMARGFADVTLSILHEIGHHFHREEYIFCDYDEYENAYGTDHFKLHCEMVATDWAIEWLQDPEHRRQAKAFERAYSKARRA